MHRTVLSFGFSFVLQKRKIYLDYTYFLIITVKIYSKQNIIILSKLRFITIPRAFNYLHKNMNVLEYLQSENLKTNFH